MRHIDAKTLRLDESLKRTTWYLGYGEIFTIDPEVVKESELLDHCAHWGTKLKKIGPNKFKVVAVEDGVEVNDEEDALNRTRHKHKSYGVAALSRCQSSGSELFGSSVRHNTIITLTISRALVARSQLHDERITSIGAGGDIVEVSMSAHQFAELITTMNMAEGVPCTITNLGGKRVRYQPPFETNLRKQAERSFKDVMGDLAKRLEQDAKDLDAILAKPHIGKKDRERIQGMRDTIRHTLTGSMPFVEGQLYEAAQKTVNEAKAEIDATITTAMLKLGGEEIARRVSGVGLPSVADEMVSIEGDTTETQPGDSAENE